MIGPALAEETQTPLLQSGIRIRIDVLYYQDGISVGLYSDQDDRITGRESGR